MSAGRLSERLVIQSATTTTDAIGGKSDAWATLATVWAEPIPIRSDERFQSQAIGVQSDYRFRIRVRSDVTAKQRILWTPRWLGSALTLEIHGALREPGRRFMVLDCGVYQ